MSDLKNKDVSDLRSRMEIIMGQLDILFKDVGPSLKKIGDLQTEAHEIYSELDRRGLIKTEIPKDGT